MRDHEFDAILFRGGDHPVAIFQRQRHRLLDHHMLARLQRRDRMLGVKRIGRGNVDRIQFLQRTQGLDAGEGLNAKFTGILRPPLLAQVGAGDKGEAGRLVNREWQRSAAGAEAD